MSDSPIPHESQPRLTGSHDGPGPAGPLAVFDELLKRPESYLARCRRGGPLRAPLILLGALVCVGAYGAASGFFQGGSEVLLAAFKAPLVLLLSALLCLPSLYVMTALGGGHVPGRAFFAACVGFWGVLSLVMAGLLPIAWLFAVSSRSLPFVVWLHIFSWVLALLLGRRVLGQAFPESRGVVLAWIFLLLFVSFQVTTYLRPVIGRAPGGPLFETGKMSFLEHLQSVYPPEPKPGETPK